MVKIKKTTKNVVKKSAQKETVGSFLSNLLHKRNRPLHGVTLGSVMVLLNSFWGVLAIIGWGLIALSAFAYFKNRK